MAGLSSEDVQSIRGLRTFMVYDEEGLGQMDAFYLADALRSLGLNPSEKTAISLGSTKEKGERKIEESEFLDIFARAQKEVDAGSMDDFVALMELYDKRGKGKIPAADLTFILQRLGEGLPKEDVDYILRITSPKVDSSGEISYTKFLTKFLGLETKNNPFAPLYESAADIFEQRRAELAAVQAAKASTKNSGKKRATSVQSATSPIPC